MIKLSAPSKVGMTRLELATSRPPELREPVLLLAENQSFVCLSNLLVDVMVYFCPPFD